MAGPIKDPQVTQQQKTNIDLYDVADFLFGVKSIERIAKGEGSWGDLLNVGVTAATFFIPPVKLLKLSGSSLNKVIAASEKVIASDTASVAAKRAAQSTLDNANKIKVPDRFTPTEKAIAEKGMEPKRYSRPTDEFGNTIDDTEYFGTGSGKTKKEVAEDIYEAKPKLKKEDIKPAQMTPEEEAFAKKFDEEMPPEPVKAPETGKAMVINRQTGELDFVDPRRLPQNVKVPKDLKVSPEVDTVGYALYKVESLTRANIKAKKLGNLEQVSKNLDEIATYNEQIKTIGKTLSPEDAAKAGKLSEQLRDAKGIKYTKFNPNEARKELENLREQWRNTTNTAERNKLKQQAKVIANRLNKMEGK